MKNSDKAISCPPSVLRVKFDTKSRSSPNPRKERLLYSPFEKWPPMKTELESGLLVHQHFAQHSLFSPPRQLQVQLWSVSILFWGDPPVFANNCLIGLPESLEPEATLDPFIKTEECQYWHRLTKKPLKSTACWFVTNVACFLRTTNFEIFKKTFLESLSLQLGDMGEISCRGAVAVWEQPAAAHLHNSLLYLSYRSKPIQDQKYQE